MSLVNELIKDLLPEEEKKSTTAIYAGGFKPPTSGHFEVVKQALKELTALRDGLEKSTNYVKTQQEFDLDTRPEGLFQGSVIRTFKSGFGFLDDEKDLLKKSDKQLKQYDALIDLLEN